MRQPGRGGITCWCRPHLAVGQCCHSCAVVTQGAKVQWRAREGDGGDDTSGIAPNGAPPVLSHRYSLPWPSRPDARTSRCGRSSSASNQETFCVLLELGRPQSCRAFSAISRLDPARDLRTYALPGAHQALAWALAGWRDSVGVARPMHHCIRRAASAMSAHHTRLVE